MAECFETHIAAVRVLDEDGRLAYLQRLIGSHTKHAYELEWRARLMTALRNSNVWPPRDADYGISPG